LVKAQTSEPGQGDGGHLRPGKGIHSDELI
jgi:hypothetical protein